MEIISSPHLSVTCVSFGAYRKEIRTRYGQRTDFVWQLLCGRIRARSTVQQNRGTVERNLASLEACGLQGPDYDPGPTPAYDFCGFETAISVHLSHKQWDSIRKVKATIANFEKVCCNTSLSILALMDEAKGHSSKFHFGESASMWYQRFGIGCRARMGQDVRQDLALSTKLWAASLEQCSKMARDSNTFGKGAG
jgi:hypothetical protein